MGRMSLPIIFISSFEVTVPRASTSCSFSLSPDGGCLDYQGSAFAELIASPGRGQSR